ncbi:hypothetical protein BGY98DRAFT_717288 [Russula aff. rugulosa BPL654]|nr:hypothetical protein BGY98DRAFT_717288 [Russula aff. rugulosa BPL654]
MDQFRTLDPYCVETHWSFLDYILSFPRTRRLPKTNLTRKRAMPPSCRGWLHINHVAITNEKLWQGNRCSFNVFFVQGFTINGAPVLDNFLKDRCAFDSEVLGIFFFFILVMCALHRNVI